MITNHPTTELLTEYATGAMSLAPLISITTHLQFCEHCRDAVAGLNALGGEFLGECEGAAISDRLLADTLDRLDEESLPETIEAAPASFAIDAALEEQLPAYLHKFVGRSPLNWRSLSSSLSVAPISVGETAYELALHKIDAGGTTPSHDHRGMELTVVLKGSFSDEHGVYHEGDFLIREPGHVHRPAAAQNQACICLSVLEAPIKLQGLKRVLNPFMQFNPS